MQQTMCLSHCHHPLIISVVKLYMYTKLHNQFKDLLKLLLKQPNLLMLQQPKRLFHQIPTPKPLTPMTNTQPPKHIIPRPTIMNATSKPTRSIKPSTSRVERPLNVMCTSMTNRLSRSTMNHMNTLLRYLKPVSSIATTLTLKRFLSEERRCQYLHRLMWLKSCLANDALKESPR